MRSALSAGIAAAAICVTVSGCSLGSDTPAGPTAAWSEPAWFAEQAREREDVTAALQGCMDSKGWSLTIDASGGISENLAALPDPEAAISDVEACMAALPQHGAVIVDDAYLRDVLYPQHLDTYACLVAHEITPDPPPDVELFVETHLAEDPQTEPWTAWGGGWTAELSFDELSALEQTCPQPYVAP